MTITDLPQLEADIRNISTMHELNRVIDVVKAQQRMLRAMVNVSAKGGLRVGDKVTCTNRGRTISGIIKKMNRTKAIVETSTTLYNIPFGMLSAA
tara:strand:+ start:2012 stop:2296 length:285 start_codon:yes stop_codon:yes gene_type:complete